MKKPIRALSDLRLSTMLLAATVLAAAPAHADGVCGDVNGTGTVTTVDALNVLKKAVGQDIILECPAGSTVSTYGQPTEYPEASNHSPGFLAGNKIEIPVNSTVIHLAYIGKEAKANVRLALYTDHLGEPELLITETDPTPVIVGRHELPVPASTVAAGSYWLMAIFDDVAAVGIEYSDDESGVEVKYRAATFANPLPASFGVSETYYGQEFNFYAKTIP